MAHWTIYEKEVFDEMETIRIYGGVDSRRIPSHGDSYKAQALRMVALNAMLRDRIEGLERCRSAAVDLLDSVSAEDMSRANGLGVDECRERMSVIWEG